MKYKSVIQKFSRTHLPRTLTVITAPYATKSHSLQQSLCIDSREELSHCTWRVSNLYALLACPSCCGHMILLIDSLQESHSYLAQRSLSALKTHILSSWKNCITYVLMDSLSIACLLKWLNYSFKLDATKFITRLFTQTHTESNIHMQFHSCMIMQQLFYPSFAISWEPLP